MDSESLPVTKLATGHSAMVLTQVPMSSRYVGVSGWHWQVQTSPGPETALTVLSGQPALLQTERQFGQFGDWLCS